MPAPRFTSAFRVCAGAIFLLCASPLAARADSFAFMTAGNDDFGVLDLTSGSFTLCGNSGVLLAGLGLAPHGVIYAAGWGTSTIYTVNRTNGALTTVGTTSLTVDDFGSTKKVLYALDFNGNLFSINPNTAAAKLVGPIGVPLAGTIGMSTGSSKLYLQNGTELYALDTKTGKAKPIGPGSTSLGALATIGGVLYGGSNVSPYSVQTVNATTGADTEGATLTGETASFWGLTATPKSETGACPTK
ncbi:MAG TPA: hypothetical protein VMB71_07160 [Acetobacteraceae bacterium]|nr:hypothetical protein [Acetobacteraceae bacterium]